MKSKSNKVPETGMHWRIAKRVCERIAAVYPYVVACYLLCLILSDTLKSWRHAFDWPALDLMLAIFSLATLVGRPKGGASARTFIAKTLVAAVLVAAALFSKIDPYSFLILLFGIGTLLYRRIHPKYALVAAGALLGAVAVLETLGKEYPALSVSVCAFYLLVILLVACFQEVTPSPS